jgi:hypothetical protein
MDDSRTAVYYLRDLGPNLLEIALSAKSDHDNASDDSDRLFASGRLFGLHEAVSLMQTQALAFEIPLSEIGLQDVIPERDL